MSTTSVADELCSARKADDNMTVGVKNRDVTAVLCTPASAGSAVGAAGSSGHLKPLMLGHFRLIALLGEGAMGKVLRAEDTKLKRHVALKCLKRKTDESPAGDEAFLRESRAAAMLDHAGIVQVFEIGVAEGFRYIAMELIEGGTLAALIKGCGSLDVARSSQLCAEAAEALHCAAEQGIVHRDIKPENLLLTRAGRCKIADFGLAAVRHGASSDPSAPAAVGTPGYVAPEVIGGLEATAESDVYSLAVVYFFLLTGQTPFGAGDPEKILRMQIESAAPDVRQFREDLPEAVAKILIRALSRNPDNRPTAAAFAKQLRSHTVPLGDSQVLSISGPSTLPTHPEPQKYVPITHRWEILSLLVGTVAVVMVVVVAWLVLRGSSTGKETPMLPPISVGSGKAGRVTPPPPLSQPEDVTAIAARAVHPPAPIPILQVGDQDAIFTAAAAHQKIQVTGTVAHCQLDRDGHIMVLTFSGNSKFALAYREELFDRMAKKFGGTRGDGLDGKTVRLTGEPEMIMDMAIISLPSIRDIELTN